MLFPFFFLTPRLDPLAFRNSRRVSFLMLLTVIFQTGSLLVPAEVARERLMSALERS